MPVVPAPVASRWTFGGFDESAARLCSEKFQLHPVVARLLCTRGWAAADDLLEIFLAPSLKRLRPPSDLSGMDAATDRILRAKRDAEKVCVYGDYDVDGVTSTAIMVSTLRFLGMDPIVIIPNRFTDGYGMNVRRVEEIAASGVALIVTVDNGVSAVEPIQRARELGVDVVVTDHHLAGDELPSAVAMVNPNCQEQAYTHGRLCGAGVAYKVAHALLKSAGIAATDARNFLYSLLDLVALGTIADVVPLEGENRIFASHGLQALFNSNRPGLRALIDVARLSGRTPNAEFVGFGLGPRINAAGRTGDADLALELLLCEDDKRSYELARELERLNQHRRALEDKILKASRDAAEQSIADGHEHLVVVAGEDWHLGVVGIVASRLVDAFGVPAIVLSVEEEFAKGSARSIPGFDIHEALCACGDHLETFGGHAGAAGLKLKHAGLNDFRGAINSHAGAIMADLDRTPVIPVDAEVDAGEVGWELYDSLLKLEPFGEGNPKPILRMNGCQPVGQPRIMKDVHIKSTVRAEGRYFDCIGFGLAHLRDAFDSPAVDLLFRPSENRFGGKAKLELELIDVKPSA